MGVKTTTVYTCDVCGCESEDPGFNNGSNSGSCKVSVKGSKGERTLTGDWGGHNINMNLLLCHTCIPKLTKAIKRLKSEG